MAARANAAEGTGNRSTAGAPTVLLRFLTAAFAGGAVLLLWNGTAGAEAPAPAPTTSSSNGAGLLTGLLGEGGALTPVVDLVDAATGSLTGTKPVGATVDGAVSTVEPIVAPVVDPVTTAVDPVLAPVVGTVGEVTTAVVTPVTASLPTTPVIPPTVPPTIPPIDPPVAEPPTGELPGTPLPELPPLLPPGSTTEPGATPGGRPTSSDDPSAVGPEASNRLAATNTDGSTTRAAGWFATDAKRTGDPSTGTAASHPSDRSNSELAFAAGDTGAATSHDRSADEPPAAPHRPAPAACTGGGTAASAAPATAAFLSSPTGTDRCGATSLETPAGTSPHSAPAAGPDVAPD